MNSFPLTVRLSSTSIVQVPATGLAVLIWATPGVLLVLGVPAAYAFARFKFRLGEDIAFTLLSTIGALLYNLCSDFVGGVEVTLVER